MPSRSSSLVAVVFFAISGCQPSDQELVGSCPSGAPPDLEAGKQVIQQKCNNCHNFDPNNLSGSVFASIDDGSMPPGRPLSADEAEQVRVLVACTTGGVGTASASGDDDGDEPEQEDEDDD